MLWRGAGRKQNTSQRTIRITPKRCQPSISKQLIEKRERRVVSVTFQLQPEASRKFLLAKVPRRAHHRPHQQTHQNTQYRSTKWMYVQSSPLRHQTTQVSTPTPNDARNEVSTPTPNDARNEVVVSWVNNNTAAMPSPSPPPAVSPMSHASAAAQATRRSTLLASRKNKEFEESYVWNIHGTFNGDFMSASGTTATVDALLRSTALLERVVLSNTA